MFNTNANARNVTAISTGNKLFHNISSIHIEIEKKTTTQWKFNTTQWAYCRAAGHQPIVEMAAFRGHTI